MRKFTKILAVILSVVMLLGVCQMVMAAEAAPEAPAAEAPAEA